MPLNGSMRKRVILSKISGDAFCLGASWQIATMTAYDDTHGGHLLIIDWQSIARAETANATDCPTTALQGQRIKCSSCDVLH